MRRSGGIGVEGKGWVKQLLVKQLQFNPPLNLLLGGDLTLVMQLSFVYTGHEIFMTINKRI